jgi:hypothetical protein
MSWLADIFSLPIDRTEPPLPEPVTPEPADAASVAQPVR